MEKEKKISKEKIALLILIIVLIIVDQITKILIVNTGEIFVIQGILKFSVTQNTSGAYGVGSNSTIMYAITNLIVIAIVYKFMASQNEYIDRKLKVFLSFIIAGGISNTIDKIFRGYVVEFIDLKQFIPLPVFNIADLLVIIGWVSLAAIFAAFTVKEMRKGKADKQENEKKENK